LLLRASPRTDFSSFLTSLALPPASVATRPICRWKSSDIFAEAAPKSARGTVARPMALPTPVMERPLAFMRVVEAAAFFLLEATVPIEASAAAAVPFSWASNLARLALAGPVWASTMTRRTAAAFIGDPRYGGYGRYDVARNDSCGRSVDGRRESA